MKTLLLKLYQPYLNKSFNQSSRIKLSMINKSFNQSSITKQYTTNIKNVMITKALTQMEPCKATLKAMKNVLGYKENSLIK